MKIHAIILLLLSLAVTCFGSSIENAPDPVRWTEHRAKEHWLNLSRRSDIRKAMRAAWAQSRAGTSGLEAGFRLDGDPNAYRIVPVSAGRDPGLLEVTVKERGAARTFAIFHVHPNSSGPEPSTPRTSRLGKGDTTIADQFEIGIFVMHRQGLSVYDHLLRRTLQIQKGMEWATKE